MGDVTMTTGRDEVEREAARAALEAIGEAWTLHECPGCGQTSDRAAECRACRHAAINPVLTLVAVVALAMIS